jgi:hypothetical protein
MRYIFAILPLLFFIACSGSSSSSSPDVNETNITEETPVEETPVEETPIEETPVEETPIEETPVEETPIEETNFPIPYCEDGEVIQLLSGDIIQKISESPEVEITHNQNGSKSVCLLSGEAEVIR